MKWIPVTERLPADFGRLGRTKKYLIFIDNPFFSDGHYHVAWYQKSSFGDKYNLWMGIEPNVHHGDSYPNVTHWCELPNPPQK